MGTATIRFTGTALEELLLQAQAVVSTYTDREDHLQAMYEILGVVAYGGKNHWTAPSGFSVTWKVSSPVVAFQGLNSTTYTRPNAPEYTVTVSFSAHTIPPMAIGYTGIIPMVVENHPFTNYPIQNLTPIYTGNPCGEILLTPLVPSDLITYSLNV